MRHTAVLLTAIFLGACTPAKKSTPPGAQIDVAVQKATYSDTAHASKEVVGKCKFELELATQVVEAIPGARVAESGNGKTLALEIVRMKGADPAWQGDISVIVRGTLAEDGTTIGTFRLKRAAVGGVLGGMRGVCKGLGGVAEMMGEDISTWIAAPTMDASLGG